MHELQIGRKAACLETSSQGKSLNVVWAESITKSAIQIVEKTQVKLTICLVIFILLVNIVMILNIMVRKDHLTTIIGLLNSVLSEHTIMCIYIGIQDAVIRLK